MTACDNVPLASQIEEFVEDMAYVQTFVETGAPTATTPQGKVRRTFAGIESDADAILSALGFIFMDPLTFQTGATLTNRNNALFWHPNDGGNGFYYRWAGALPKTVAPGSTPLTSGGLGQTAWIAVQNNLSYIQETKPAADFLPGIRWHKPSIASTMVRTILNGNKHWIEEFVKTGSNEIFINSIAELRSRPGSGDGEIVNVVSYYDGWAAVAMPPQGGGAFVWDSTSTLPDDNVSVYGSAPAGRWFRRDINGEIDITWAGAIGLPSFDSTQAVKDCVAYAKKPDSRGRVVFSPAGVYKLTSQILIDDSGIVLRGVYEKGRVAGSGTLSYSGSHFVYHGTDGASIVKFSSLGGTVGTFHPRVESIRIGAADGLFPKPKAALEWVNCSEGTIENVHLIGGCKTGLLLDTCTITRVDNMDIAANEVGIRFVSTTSFGSGAFNSDVWLSRLNVFNSSEASIRFENTAAQISITNSWLEWAPSIILVQPSTDVDVTILSLKIDFVSFVGGGGGPLNSRSIKVQAYQGGTKSTLVENVTVKNSTLFNTDAVYNIEYNKGTNTGPTSLMRDVYLENNNYFGASTSAVYSDSGQCRFFFDGRHLASTGYYSGSTIPLTSGPYLKSFERLDKDIIWDLKKNNPIALPENAILDNFSQGLMRYNYSNNTIECSKATAEIGILAFMAEYHDSVPESATLLEFIQSFNSLLDKLKATYVVRPTL